MKAIHGVVTGHVQGVGYRQGCRSIARANHLVGWVRNRADGRVELHAQGAEGGLDVLVTWLWGGPAWADVVGVETEVVPIDLTLTDFFIQPDEKT